MIRGTEHHDRLVEGEWLQIHKKQYEVMTAMHKKVHVIVSLLCKEGEALYYRYSAGFRIRIRMDPH